MTKTNTLGNVVKISTLRPNDAPDIKPKLVVGLVGVTSFKEVGGEEVPEKLEGFIHWSQSCAILDKAVFSRSEYCKNKPKSCSVHHFITGKSKVESWVCLQTVSFSTAKRKE